MKFKLTENQVRGLFRHLNEDAVAQSQYTPQASPNLQKFIDFLLSDVNVKTPGNNAPTSNAPVMSPEDELMHPLGHKKTITSTFGSRSSGIGSSNHKGVDINTPSGSPVYAPNNGKVIEAKDTSPNGCGGYVKLDHKDIQTKFCHLKQWVVRKGDTVKKGQVIGYSGGGIGDPYRGTSTGPHLHYEILNMGGIAMNPVNVQPNLA